jgi:hypothetical protein
MLSNSPSGLVSSARSQCKGLVDSPVRTSHNETQPCYGGSEKQDQGSTTSLASIGCQDENSIPFYPVLTSPSSASGKYEVIRNTGDAMINDSFVSVAPLHTATSQASTPPFQLTSTIYKFESRPSSRSCSNRSLQQKEDKTLDYSGMPKVDDDIEVGQKITRRRKLSTQCPPSSNHKDVQPPPLNLVQQALRQHKVAGARRFKRSQSKAVNTEFHDENGQMFLCGSKDGKYVGDILGGLPHGHGQHWIPKRCPPCGGPTGESHLLYEGAWEYGSKQGFGHMMYANRQVRSCSKVNGGELDQNMASFINYIKNCQEFCCIQICLLKC